MPRTSVRNWSRAITDGGGRLAQYLLSLFGIGVNQPFRRA